MAFKLSENLSVKKSLEIAVATSSVYRYMFENRKYEYVSRQESKFEWHFMAQLKKILKRPSNQHFYQAWIQLKPSGLREEDL
jgi:hypothetical protein